MGLTPSSIEVVRVKIERPRLPASFHGFRIAFLSDLHYGSPGVRAALMERAVELAMAEHPDVLCYGGDMVTGWSEPKSLGEILTIVGSAQAPLGTYAVMGNHEFLWGETAVMRAFEKTSIRLLRNETAQLVRGAARLPLIGLDNLLHQNLSDVEAQLREIESHRACVVIEHTPDIAPLFRPSFSGVVLSGHTHGGQILLPLLGQTISSSRFGSRYVSGLYPVENGAMYVTRGVGAVLLPARVGCPPEVTLIELVRSQETSA